MGDKVGGVDGDTLGSIEGDGRAIISLQWPNISQRLVIASRRICHCKYKDIHGVDYLVLCDERRLGEVRVSGLGGVG